MRYILFLIVDVFWSRCKYWCCLRAEEQYSCELFVFIQYARIYYVFYAQYCVLRRPSNQLCRSQGRQNPIRTDHYHQHEDSHRVMYGEWINSYEIMLSVCVCSNNNNDNHPEGAYSKSIKHELYHYGCYMIIVLFKLVELLTLHRVIVYLSLRISSFFFCKSP